MLLPDEGASSNHQCCDGRSEDGRDGRDGCSDDNGSASLSALRSFASFLSSNDEVSRTRLATGPLSPLAPRAAVTMRCLFGCADCRGCPFQVGATPGACGFEGAPSPLLDRVAAFLDVARAETRAATCAKEGALLSRGGGADASGARRATEEPHRAPPPLQKKIGDAGGGAGWWADTAAADNGEGEPRAAPRPRPTRLVVCASLVDKPANLGGLARTAEAFGVECLVVPDEALSKTPEFRALSVEAHRWVPMAAVSLPSLPSYLRSMKAKGYAIVALEQTTHSVLLPAFAFPRLCVLLLGAEGKGVPPNLLALADSAVEVPQAGRVRSLNVHVAASVAVYAYAAQHPA